MIFIILYYYYYYYLLLLLLLLFPLIKAVCSFFCEIIVFTYFFSTLRPSYSNFCRAYMHGFFIDIRLYKKIRSIVEPEVYADWREERIKEKLAKKAESRITMIPGQQKQKPTPIVNKDLASRLMQKNTSSERRMLIVSLGGRERERKKERERERDRVSECLTL